MLKLCKYSTQKKRFRKRGDRKRLRVENFTEKAVFFSKKHY